MIFADSGETIGTLFLIVWVPLMIYAYYRLGKFLHGAWGNATTETREKVKDGLANSAARLWRWMNK